MRRIFIIMAILCMGGLSYAQTAENDTTSTDEKVEIIEKSVVTGYTRTNIRRVTGSVAVLRPETFLAKPSPTIDALLQGETAGVSVRAVSGQPGVDSRIRIRGIGNLSANTSPLWVVDGVPLQSESPSLSSEQLAAGGFDDIFVSGVGGINPADIESITILKDASAAAIYGSRAANGVIVVTTRRGRAGRMKTSYSNTLKWSFRPQRSLDLMNSSEKLAWEQTLWDEFSADRYNQTLTDPTAFYPVIGIVGQIRSGAISDLGTKEAQDSYIAQLGTHTTDWYGQLFRNAFSHNHHLSLSGGSDGVTYYISGGLTDENGMLIHNTYRRYNITSNVVLKPTSRLKLDLGIDASRQKSVTPDSSVDPFTYAYFANPYERAYNDDGSYGSDRTWFTLGYYNGRMNEQVIPDEGFSIMRELDLNSTTTTNTTGTVRASGEYLITDGLFFNALASYTSSNGATDKITDKSTYTAFNDRMGNDHLRQDLRYGSIIENRSSRDNYILRGHFDWTREFKRSRLNVIAGAEIRASSSRTTFNKRYNYDPVTGTSSLPEISGPTDQWLRQAERLSGSYFTDSRYASFYTSGDYTFRRNIVFNASVRTDGSSHFGSHRQFNPTWSAGAAWHIGDESFMQSIPVISHATIRAAYGFTGNISTAATHLLVMRYLQQQYRYYNGTTLPLGTIPSAPNPNLGWEKTRDLKFGIDAGFFGEQLTLSTEAYHRLSTDVVTSSAVQTTTGFSSVYFNSADIANTGVEATLTWSQYFPSDIYLRVSANIAYNYNRVVRYNPALKSITSKDRYVEGYPVGSIFAGEYGGIDPTNGLYLFRLREDAGVSSISDLNNPDNYRVYLGTTNAPVGGGINISLKYKKFGISVSGVYSIGAKAYDNITSPASYLNARREGSATEEVQSQYSDLYSNHLNVTRDRVSRWTETNTKGVKYPRIYDRFSYVGNFAATEPMSSDIVNAIYVKDVSYLRIKSIVLSYGIFRLSLDNFFTFTPYDGMDPEIPGATYPTTRSVSCGINLDF